MPIRIDAVRSHAGRRRFVAVPWSIYDRTRHAQWSPPLRVAVRDALDEGKNPFYAAAEIQLFVATDGSRSLGRIAAVHNRAHNDFHDERTGFFGFFECVDDPGVARGLLDAATAWLGERGLETARGPVSPSTNHECGLLVRGFRHPQMFMTPWNPRYYGPLLEGAGFRGVRDLLGYWIPMDPERWTLPERVAAHAERARKRQGVTFRDVDTKHYARDIGICWQIYNSAWERNWGFVPMTRQEFEYQALQMKPLLDPRFAFIAEVDGEPAGFMLILLDFNRILQRNPSGRLFPLGLPRLLLGKKKLRTGRIIALGIKEEYRSRSIFSVFAHEAYRRGLAMGAIGAEASWILEDNEKLNGPLRALGAKVYRRWRGYEKGVG